MPPRNNDADAGYQKNACTDDADADIKATLPCLMHKKHKVVKLVKSQLLKIQQEGLMNDMSRPDLMMTESDIMTRGDFHTAAGPSAVERKPRKAEYREGNASYDSTERGRNVKNISVICYFLVFFLALLLLILLIVWISAGPLSNSMAHTPISPSAFVRTDSICSLEKKYLLRWSKPGYLQ